VTTLSDALLIAPDHLRIARALEARLAGKSAQGAQWRVGEVSPLGGGHSGFTYLVRPADGDRRLVLRLSPPDARISGPNDVGRQGQIMNAVRALGVPVPRVLDFSSDPVIDGRAFVLMDWVDGEPWDATGLSHHEVARQAVGVAGRIGKVIAAASGIGEEAARSPSMEVDRWAALLPRCPDWLQAAAQPLYADLARTAPPAGRVGLVHGDFHYGNLLFRDDQVVAVFDWEIAGLGDPLFDLGALAVAGLRRRYAPEPNPTGNVEIGVEELAAMYPADPSRFSWFVASSCFKYSAILGYNYQLHRRGKRVDRVYESLLGTTRGLLQDADNILGTA
jgi:aminoglycoside phosphotransferase (APT) family kinase protein